MDINKNILNISYFFSACITFSQKIKFSFHDFHEKAMLTKIDIDKLFLYKYFVWHVLLSIQ